MTESSHQVSSRGQDFTWLLSKFIRETAGVTDTIAVSSDGLLMAVAGETDRAGSERLSAIVSGMSSLAAGAGYSRGLGRLNKVTVDAEGGYLIIMAMSAGASLGVVAQRTASLATVAYEMALFINRINGILSPQMIMQLTNSATG